jgi:hypothetical protein
MTARPSRWRNRLAEAQSTADQFAAQCDRLRAAAKRMQRPQADLTARRLDSERAGQLLGTAAEYLGNLADSMERGEHDYLERVTP